MLDSLKNFTITALHIKLNLPEQEFQQWLTDLGLLHKKRTCVCGREMRKEKHHQYGRWVCKMKTCRKTTGALVGTFFSKFNLTLQKVMQVFYFFGCLSNRYICLDNVFLVKTTYYTYKSRGIMKRDWCF